jgi:hypothetical protein
MAWEDAVIAAYLLDAACVPPALRQKSYCPTSGSGQVCQRRFRAGELPGSMGGARLETADLLRVSQGMPSPP